MAAVEGYLALDEAAAKYHISTRQLRRLCQTGQVEAVKIGGIWLVRPGSIEMYNRSPKRRERKNPTGK